MCIYIYVYVHIYIYIYIYICICICIYESCGLPGPKRLGTALTRRVGLQALQAAPYLLRCPRIQQARSSASRHPQAWMELPEVSPTELHEHTVCHRASDESTLFQKVYNIHNYQLVAAKIRLLIWF